MGSGHWKFDWYQDRVIFSDECKAVIGGNNSVYVCRRPGEEWMQQRISPGRKRQHDEFGLYLLEWTWYTDSCER